MYEVHLVRAFGNVSLRAIDFERIDRFKRAMKSPKRNGEMRGDKAINKILTLLGTMLRNALDKKLIDTLPKILLVRKD